VEPLQLTTPTRTALPSASRASTAARRARGVVRSNGDGRRAWTADTALARGLAWFSLGLGALEVAAPRRLARFLGIDHHDALFRVLGFREMASGLGILAQRHPTAGVWSRVGGDVVDLSLLAAALGRSTAPHRVMASLAAVGGVTALDVVVGDRLARRSSALGTQAPRDGTIEVSESIAINAEPQQAYAFWRQLENLPRFMKHLAHVQERGERRSHWVARAPGGGTVEWDAEIVDEVPNELIEWRSVEAASVPNSGSVRFTRDRAGRGTCIEVRMRYEPPLGGAGALIAKLFGEEPAQQMKEDLRRLKQIIETGEIPTTEGQPSGRARDARAKARSEAA
jgi:uncharacterized membrane protein